MFWLFALFEHVTFAQQPVLVAGVPVWCTAPNGMPVPILFDPTINDVGVAIPGSPWVAPHIRLNPTILGRLPPVMQLFFVAHECGHHQGYVNEQQADCWAASTGQAQGWFNYASLQAAAATMAGNPGDWTHLPGPLRVQTMASCMR